jgi:hypothetical protein
MFIGNVMMVRTVITTGRMKAGQIPIIVNKTPSVSEINPKKAAIEA